MINLDLAFVVQIVNFGLLVLVLNIFLYKPIRVLLAQRRQEIQSARERAVAVDDQVQAKVAEYEERLREAKQQASEIIAQAEKRAAQLVDEAKENAKREGDRLIAGAQSEIEQQVQYAKEALRQQVAELAVAGAEKILQREVDQTKHAEILASIKTGL